MGRGASQDPTTVWTADQLIGSGIGRDVQPPGTGGYSTTNYIPLQEVAEELTGTSIQDLIAQRMTEPLGMTDGAAPERGHHPARARRTRIPELGLHRGGQGRRRSVPEGQDPTDWNACYGQGGGGMQSTITDLGRWAPPAWATPSWLTPPPPSA